MKNRSIFPKPYADFVARLRVPMGFLMVAAFAWLSTPTLRSIVTGGSIALLGLLLRGWAAGHLRKNQNLTTSGPYAFLRNPLYVGTLIVAMGFAVATLRWELAALFGAVFLLVYLPAITLEEQHLSDLFPEFSNYADKVPMLIPYKAPIPNERGFSLSQYFHNREYEAGIAFFLGIAFLFAKTMYLT